MVCAYRTAYLQHLFDRQFHLYTHPVNHASDPILVDVFQNNIGIGLKLSQKFRRYNLVTSAGYVLALLVRIQVYNVDCRFPRIQYIQKGYPFRTGAPGHYA